MWYCLPLTVKGSTRLSVVLLVKAEFSVAIMKILMVVRFAKVGFGINESMFLCRDVEFGAPALSSR